MIISFILISFVHPVIAGVKNMAKKFHIFSTETNEQKTDYNLGSLGYGKLEEIKCDFNATRDPTIGDDRLKGYSAGSYWKNTKTNKLFVCINNYVAQAIWRQSVRLDKEIDHNQLKNYEADRHINWKNANDNLVTSKDITGANINALIQIQLSGADINTAGTLTNVAYLNLSDLAFTNTKLGFFSATSVTQRTKATHNNWANLSDVVNALVELGLFDTA